MVGKFGMKMSNHFGRHPELDSGSHLDTKFQLKFPEILNQVQNDVGVKL